MDPLALEADLPPAARHVAHVLQERGPCTQPELVEITTLPETTVDDALARLALPLLIGQTQRARGSAVDGTIRSGRSRRRRRFSCQLRAGAREGRPSTAGRS